MHLTTPNNTSINSQFGWIFIWVLELIVCDCTYSFICDKMIWHIEIREYKPWVLHHTLIEFNFIVKYALQFFFNWTITKCAHALAYWSVITLMITFYFRNIRSGDTFFGGFWSHYWYAQWVPLTSRSNSYNNL